MTAKISVYNVGDKIKIKSGKEHSKDTKNKIGTITEINNPALGIKFEGMEDVHKWYVDEEVEKV